MQLFEWLRLRSHRRYSSIWIFEKTIAITMSKTLMVNGRPIAIERREIRKIAEALGLPEAWIMLVFLCYDRNLGAGAVQERAELGTRFLARNPAHASILGIFAAIQFAQRGDDLDALVREVDSGTEGLHNLYERELLRILASLTRKMLTKTAEETIEEGAVYEETVAQVKWLVALGDLAAPIFAVHLLNSSLERDEILRSMIRAGRNPWSTTAFHPWILLIAAKEVLKT